MIVSRSVSNDHVHDELCWVADWLKFRFVDTKNMRSDVSVADGYQVWKYDIAVGISSLGFCGRGFVVGGFCRGGEFVCTSLVAMTWQRSNPLMGRRSSLNCWRTLHGNWRQRLDWNGKKDNNREAAEVAEDDWIIGENASIDSFATKNYDSREVVTVSDRS